MYFDCFPFFAFIGGIVGLLISILIGALILSAVLHVVSIIIKNSKLAFMRTFPLIFVVLLVLGLLQHFVL